MDILFQGRHNPEQASLSLREVLSLLKDRYQVYTVREMYVTVTLVDAEGQDIELVDQQTNQPYRVLEVCEAALEPQRRVGRPSLKLVINNT